MFAYIFLNTKFYLQNIFFNLISNYQIANILMFKTIFIWYFINLLYLKSICEICTVFWNFQRVKCPLCQAKMPPSVSKARYHIFHGSFLGAELFYNYVIWALENNNHASINVHQDFKNHNLFPNYRALICLHYSNIRNL